MLQKAIFLDRDGVLNRELGHYVSQVSEMEINHGAIFFLQKAISMGYNLIVITNQGGIAKGLYSEETLLAIHTKMQEDFQAHGISFLDILYCPHHTDFGKCLCRKPDSLMIEKALHKHSIQPNGSFMIGDRPRDVEAASKAGIKGILVDSNSDLERLMPFL